jgi:hypothetical protein
MTSLALGRLGKSQADAALLLDSPIVWDVSRGGKEENAEEPEVAEVSQRLSEGREPWVAIPPVTKCMSRMGHPANPPVTKCMSRMGHPAPG